MSDLRSDIAQALEGWLTPEQMKTLLEEVLAVKKTARGWCPKCNKAVQVEIPDAGGVVGAMTRLAAEGFGKPKEQQTVEAGVTFVRKVVYGGAEK